MYCRLTSLFLLVSLLPVTSQAAIIDIEEFGLFSYSTGWSGAAADLQIGHIYSTFNDVGLQVSFANNLDSNNLGTVTWRVENQSGATLDNFVLFAYLNADIDFGINTFFNEYASFIGNTSATSWEIDEPGYVFGDIYDNLEAGSLDNFNAVDSGNPEDVSFALGFDFGSFLNDSWIEATLEISLDNIGGIQHTDPDSDFSFFFNGSLDQSDSPVVLPAPSTLVLFGAAVPFLLLFRRKNRTA